jgi:membrane fusion protein (multidrug efflux system)
LRLLISTRAAADRLTFGFLLGIALPIAAAAATPLPSVIVTPVASANIAPSFSNIGHVIAIQSVAIVPRVTAFIDNVDVSQGSTVKTGQVLFSLQPAQYQAALQTAQAALASAQAALANAQLEYERAARLNATGFEATANLDSDITTRNEDQANVLAAEASVANAQLNLSYCTITAPIDGRIGAVALTKGNLVTTTTGTLLTINQIDPIRVEFSVSSNSPLLYPTQNASATKNGTSGAPAFTVSLQLPNGKNYPIKGKIAFFDNQVDSQTGTVNVYADFANPNSELLPGEYVNVQTAPATPVNALLVPVAAVQTDQNSQYVLTLGPGNKVQEQAVTLGDQIAQNFVVKSGLAAGDQVIVDGMQKVKVGDEVNPSLAPPAPAGQSNAATSD